VVAWAAKVAKAMGEVRGKLGGAVVEASAATAARGQQQEEDPDGNAVFCTDGSGGHAKEKGLRRCGWAYACIAKGKLVHFVAGPLPGEHQSVPRAELYAIVALLESSSGPKRLQIWSDHANHVRKMTEYLGDGSVALPRSHQDLWVRARGAMDKRRRGGAEVRIGWVNSHATSV